MNTRKDVSIQSLRGLAIILMVAGHVIGSNATRGLEVSDDSLWRLSYLSLEDLRMPLFTTISGFVYALRPLRGRQEYPQLVKGKARRLLVPLVTVGTLLFAMQSIIPGVNSKPDPSDLWRVYLFDFEHLWFLQAIFLIFLAIGGAEIAGWLRSFTGWTACLTVACVLHVAWRAPADSNFFSINGALRLLPFFLLGLGLYRFRDRLDTQSWLWISAPLFAAAYGCRLAGILSDTELPGPVARLLSLAVGLTGLVTIFLVRQYITNKALAWLGAYSFAVYLLHVFAAAGSRLVLERLGVHADALLFVLCLAIGIALPVIFERLFGRFALISWGILGQKPRRRPPVKSQDALSTVP